MKKTKEEIILDRLINVFEKQVRNAYRSYLSYDNYRNDNIEMPRDLNNETQIQLFEMFMFWVLNKRLFKKLYYWKWRNLKPKQRKIILGETIDATIEHFKNLYDFDVEKLQNLFFKKKKND